MLAVISVLMSLQAPIDSTHCVAAARFLRDTQHMVTITETDTIDDWRTHQRLAGCRVTAAGGSDVGVPREATRLYERLRAAQWTRTPDPKDSPNEGSLRFRWQRSDCLFNVNAQALLNTDAEMRVNDRVHVAAGATRYQVFVMCTPALPAKESATLSAR